MNVEQRRGSNSMGLSIRNLALPPNMVRVDSTVHTNNAPEAASTPEPSAQRPEAASTPEPPAQRFETAATPEQPAQRPETAALELPPLWFVADAAATLSVWDDARNQKILDVQPGAQMRVFCPMKREGRQTWAKVCVFHDTLGSLAIGWTVVADEESGEQFLQELRF